MKLSSFLTSFVVIATLPLLAPVSTQAALLASDNATNAAYAGPTWTTSTNGGTGFGAWSFSTSGSGGSFIGSTGQGTNSFGVFAGGNSGNTSRADRAFTGALSNNQTFSVNVGHTSNITTGGEVGINLLSGSSVVFTIKFVGGGSTWTQNNGGTDFGISQNFAANTSLAFSFTLVSGATKNYNYSLGSASGTNFFGSGAGDWTNITSARFFSNGQGGGENFGLNNLIIVPEPATAGLLGMAAIGMVGIFRRRR